MLDPEHLSFISLGEGSRRICFTSINIRLIISVEHNKARIFSGLYEHAGHVVPYVVFVKVCYPPLTSAKVGTDSERTRPGNRGKRDSQMVLMRFLNKVHYNFPMAPAELEVFHQIKNVIGVSPSNYEFLLSIDADTG